MFAAIMRKIACFYACRHRDSGLFAPRMLPYAAQPRFRILKKNRPHHLHLQHAQLFRWDTMQMGYYSDGVLFRWGTMHRGNIQMGYYADGVLFRWGTMQMGYYCDGVLFRWVLFR